jgi:hypothetical protein
MNAHKEWVLERAGLEQLSWRLARSNNGRAAIRRTLKRWPVRAGKLRAQESKGIREKLLYSDFHGSVSPMTRAWYLVIISHLWSHPT